MHGSIVSALALGGSLAAGAADISRKVVLFNGKDLAAWDTQGTATWAVAGGEITGSKTAQQAAWAHLVSREAFGDAYFRVIYKVDSGNSGAYLRGAIGGDYGVTGLQVEMGGNDGSMMSVIPRRWEWLPGNPVANPQAPLGQWHELGIKVQGQTVSTSVNGKEFMVRTIDTALMPLTGRLAFQLHSSDKPVRIHLREVVAYVPTLIKGCADPAYMEFNGQVNEPDAKACLTRKATGTVAGKAGSPARVGGKERKDKGKWRDACGRLRAGNAAALPVGDLCVSAVRGRSRP